MSKEYFEGYNDAIDINKMEVSDAITMIKTGRLEDGIALLERNFFPTWQDAADCEARYREVIGRGS